MPVVVPPHQERWSTIRTLDIQDESPTAGPVHHRALHDQPITLLRPHRWLPSSAAAVPGCTRSILAPNGAAEPATSARRLGTQPQARLTTGRPRTSRQHSCPLVDEPHPVTTLPLTASSGRLRARARPRPAMTCRFAYASRAGPHQELRPDAHTWKSPQRRRHLRPGRTSRRWRVAPPAVRPKRSVATVRHPADVARSPVSYTHLT